MANVEASTQLQLRSTTSRTAASLPDGRVVATGVPA